MQETPYGFCQCGCGGQAPVARWSRLASGWVGGEPKRFIHGHNTRGHGTPASERFWRHVAKTDGCWNWTAATAPSRGNSNRYGNFTAAGGSSVRAHRFVYELMVGPIPEGLVIDHLCRNTLCVNPDHLEAVSARENVLRGVSIVAQQAAQTHCKRGHPLSGYNLIVRPGNRRECRACKQAANRAYEARKRAAATAALDGAPSLFTPTLPTDLPRT